MPDVFVSYSRHDGEFVQRLAGVDRRTAGSRSGWTPRESRTRKCFPEAIKRAIEQSDAFLFVITPASVALGLLRERGRVRPRDAEADRAGAARAGARRRAAAGDPRSQLDPVHRRRASSTRRWSGWSRRWTPISRRARAHPLAGQSAGVGRRGPRQELPAARLGAEVGRGAGWRPARRTRTRRRRSCSASTCSPAATRRRAASGRWSGRASPVALVSIGLLIFALISRGQARVASGSRPRAQALAAESQAQLPNDPEISLILGMRAVRSRRRRRSLFALRAALDASPLERALPSVASPGSCGINGGLAATFSPDGRQIAEAACNGTLRLIDAGTGTSACSRTPSRPLSSVAYSPNGSLLAVGTRDGRDPGRSGHRLRASATDRDPPASAPGRSSPSAPTARCSPPTTRPASRSGRCPRCVPAP